MPNEAITCSQSDLISRLKSFPSESDFTIHDDDHFVQWCNGHCFYWVRKDGAWEIDEL